MFPVDAKYSVSWDKGFHTLKKVFFCKEVIILFLKNVFEELQYFAIGGSELCSVK